MSTLVKVQRKGQVNIPPSLCTEVGLSDGDYVEAKAERGKIVLTPKTIGHRTNTDDQYTPAQRRVIDAGIAEGLKDFREGRLHGPFTGDEAVAFLKSQMRQPATRG